MGGGGFVGTEAANRAELYEGRITGYFILACVVGSLGGSLFGYDLGLSSGVTAMDDFLKEFFPTVYRRKQAHRHESDYCKYDNQVLTLFTSSLYFAALVSTFGASLVTRRYGRRTSIMSGAVSFFLGSAINAGAVNIFMLIAGRILLGFGIGFGNQAVPLYLSEIAPPKIRGAVNQLFQLTTVSGILVADVVNYFTEKLHPWGWRLSLGLAVVPAILMFIGGAFLPETPNSLVEQGKLEEARRILEKVRGTHRVDAEFEDLKEASDAARAVKHPFRNLLKPRNRPQLIIGALAIPAFQQLSGMNSILFYAPEIFQSLGMGSGAALYSNIMSGSMLVIGALVSIAVADRLGRRFLFIEGGTQMIASMIVVAVILALKIGNGETISRGLAATLVIAICAFVVSYGWSWGPLGWLVPSEIFPLETRSAGQSIVVCVNMFFTAAIAQCFLAMLCHMKWGVFILFAGLIVIMSLFIILLLPETKQVPIEEMSQLWQKHWYWKHIVSKDPDRTAQSQQQGKRAAAGQVSPRRPSGAGLGSPLYILCTFIASVSPRDGGERSSCYKPVRPAPGSDFGEEECLIGRSRRLIGELVMSSVAAAIGGGSSGKGKAVAAPEAKMKMETSGKPIIKQKSAAVVGKLEGKTGISSTKTVTKTINKTVKGRAAKKVYSLPGQKYDPPEEREPLRIFYESLSGQIPSSEMAEIWMMEHGLLSPERAKKAYERKQRRQQQQRLGTPIKSNKQERPESSKKPQVSKNGDVKAKKRVNHSDDDDDDFIVKSKKAK
ncbi:unnamed protein product [Musa banksii]